VALPTWRLPGAAEPKREPRRKSMRSDPVGGRGAQCTVSRRAGRIRPAEVGTCIFWHNSPEAG